MKVTILGAGHMGSAMAQRLQETGHQVTAWDRDPQAVARADSAGITVGADIGTAVASADAVITMVTAGRAVHETAEVMLPSLPPGAVWIQASTVGADWADRLRVLADRHGIPMLDAPVSGSTGPARSGTLSWLVAGPAAAIDTVRPALDSLGQRIIVAGEGQQASRLKLIVNGWMTAATVAMADALAAADRLDVPRSALLQVIGDGPLAMPYAVQKAQLMTSGDYTPGFPVQLALKDVRLLEEAVSDQPALAHTVEQRLARAADAGHADDDLAAVATVH